jgi:hypothetical protein
LQQLFELLIAELQLLDSACELPDLSLKAVKAHAQIGCAYLCERFGLCLRRLITTEDIIEKVGWAWRLLSGGDPYQNDCGSSEQRRPENTSRQAKHDNNDVPCSP